MILLFIKIFLYILYHLSIISLVLLFFIFVYCYNSTKYHKYNISYYNSFIHTYNCYKILMKFIIYDVLIFYIIYF